MEKIRLDRLKPYLPNIVLTNKKAQLISYWWREFYENPERYKDTPIPHIIEEWLNARNQ